MFSSNASFLVKVTVQIVVHMCINAYYTCMQAFNPWKPLLYKHLFTNYDNSVNPIFSLTWICLFLKRVIFKGTNSCDFWSNNASLNFLFVDQLNQWFSLSKTFMSTIAQWTQLFYSVFPSLKYSNFV